jgi:alkylation response protein AidB-like acyl-CoA dehydrogenase
MSDAQQGHTLDFSLNEQQQELQGLAKQILEKEMTPERVKEVELGDGFARGTWHSLAEAGLLGIALPESVGGLGFGYLDLCLLLEEVGRVAAPLPVVPTLVSGALAVAEFGSDAQQTSLLPGVVDGSLLLTAAFSEYDAEADHPATAAVAKGDGFVLTGVKTGVPYALLAHRILVSAASAEGIVLAFVEPDAAGVTLESQIAENWQPQSQMTLDGVTVDAADVLVSGAAGRDALDWILARTTVALCALAAGVADTALRMTAEYTTTRKQFDRPIGTFQAVGQRLADAFIDRHAINLTMLQAASHLDEGGDVPEEVATAKYWAGEGGSRIGHAALHVHGGVSIDVDYPIHRYFLWAKQIEFTLGASTPQLVKLGKLLADSPVR